MKKTHACRLRWQMAVPLILAFSLLWLGTMALLTRSVRQRLDQTVSTLYQEIGRAHV